MLRIAMSFGRVRAAVTAAQPIFWVERRTGTAMRADERQLHVQPRVGFDALRILRG